MGGEEEARMRKKIIEVEGLERGDDEIRKGGKEGKRRRRVLINGSEEEEEKM